MTRARPSADVWAVPGTPVLSRTATDRIAERRTDAAWLDEAWQRPSTRVLVVSAAGTVATAESPSGPVLALVRPPDAPVAGVRVLLGADSESVYFGLLAESDQASEDWRDLRELGPLLTDLDVGLLTAAVALQAWHQRHVHCPRCGAITEVIKAGWTRRCTNDGSEHFPRTDPAVIMLVHDGAGRCVLARGPQWPPGRMSVLAGFVEAGESAEAAVVREVGEEVGIAIRDVHYVASQPHPFPASLMLGFTARVDGDPTLRIDHDEIIEAGWYTRAEIRATGEWGAEAGGEGPGLRGLPGTMSIARQLINAWLQETDEL